MMMYFDLMALAMMMVVVVRVGCSNCAERQCSCDKRKKNSLHEILVFFESVVTTTSTKHAARVELGSKGE
jgi:hypothetical protein